MDALICRAIFGLALAAGPIAGPTPNLKPKDIENLLAKATERASFLGSREAIAEKETLYRFFGQKDYASLRGNPVLGFWDRTGFRWEGTRVSWAGMKSATSSAQRISSRSWSVAFREVAKRHSLEVVQGAAIRIEAACIAAVIDPSPSEPTPGVLLEVRIHSPAGVLRHRYAVGKPTVEEAMGAALDFVLTFAQGAAE